MRGVGVIAGLGAALAVYLCAPAVAAAAAPTSAATLPLWIDPQLLGAPAPSAPVTAAPARSAPAAAPPRFTVTRVAADGTRSTAAIDAGELQALGRPRATVAAPPPRPAVRAQAEPTPQRAAAVATAPVLQASTVAVGAPAPARVTAGTATRRAEAKLLPPETVALQAAARRLTVEPTWTSLARRSLAAGAEPGLAASANSGDDKKKAEGKAAFGVRDGRRYGETGRFYMYAAMKNRGVGMNVVDRGESWSGDGLSYDRGGFAGQRSAGVGWRKGDVSTSLGWVHEKNRINGLFGAPAEKDDRLSLTFSWRPKVPETAPPVTK